MIKNLSGILERYEKAIPLVLFLLFLAVSVPGVNWGLPAIWNPDELVGRAAMALGGEMIFDESEPDFNYPSLPKYLMLGIGKLTYALGYSRMEFLLAARIFSATLGALAAVMIYSLTRTIGASAAISGLAGLLYIAAGLAPANGRFAHNDLYLQLFAILCVTCAIKYQYTKSRLWIHGSFLAVGLAASSKYTGTSLLLVPLFVLVVMNWNWIRQNLLQAGEILFIGAALSFAGYAIGTPKSLLWMAYYFKRVIPALQRYPLYGFNSGAAIGLYGQWEVFEQAVGTFAYILFLAAFIWFVLKLVLGRFGRSQLDPRQAQGSLILIFTLLIFDLPFLVSVNYIPRYFIPFVPFLAILGAFLVNDLFTLFRERGWRWAPAGLSLLLVGGVFYSILRLISTALLFMNDARMPAGEFIATLHDKNKILEYTLYPPNLDRGQFLKARNYPIYFVKYPGEVAPTGGRVEYNQGEAGLIYREVYYLVIDTFTYSRLYNEAICDTNPVECDFFLRLLAGEIASFRLIGEFTYSLPPYLPHVYISAVNPEVRVYERVR